MRAAIILFILGFVAIKAQESCYTNSAQACSPSTSKLLSTNLTNCNAKYGAIEHVVSELQAYANTHVSRSFEYLLMSTHYANYEKNRPGFEKLFRDLSDSKWAQAIELIKYIGKRGGRMNFSRWNKNEIDSTDPNYELYELESVAKALDMEKKLALEAHSIHQSVTRRNDLWHDPEISSYIEEEFVHKHANKIRQLAGYTSDLNSLLRTKDRSLALYLFDGYLQKSL